MHKTNCSLAPASSSLEHEGLCVARLLNDLPALTSCTVPGGPLPMSVWVHVTVSCKFRGNQYLVAAASCIRIVAIIVAI